ncbi:MAG: dephospho-CoA kinase [Bdellovibrionaceae bacterium]|nr:dephospho-CoA kinase [Pseudobdellovibrionaceae bacterium]
MKWIGLTGGIATGKSTVTGLIESRGFTVIDADRISHEMTQLAQPGYVEILSHFGSDILDASLRIDRKKLGQIVFSSPEHKKVLENILHPLIQERVQELKDHHEVHGASVLFYDVPLLFENNLTVQFDSVVMVWCQEDIQLQRLMKRNNLSQAEAQTRMQAQMPMTDKIRKSNYCIDNSGSEFELIMAVDVFLQHLTGRTLIL